MKLRSLFSGLIFVLSISAVVGLCVENPSAKVVGDWIISDKYSSKIIGYAGNQTEVTIPYELNGQRVTVTIEEGPDGTTDNLKNVKKVTFAPGYKKMTTSTIIGFENVEELVIPDTVTELQHLSFNDLKKLKKVQLSSSLKNIGYCSFRGCSSLESITIPEGVVKIERSAFEDCSSLKSVSLPNSLEEVEYGVFTGCSGLKDKNGCVIILDRLYYMEVPDGVTDITIPNGVKMIEAELFRENKNIKKVVIPDSVTWIEHRTFYECEKLESVSIPDSVTYIGVYAFAHCSSLKDL